MHTKKSLFNIFIIQIEYTFVCQNVRYEQILYHLIFFFIKSFNTLAVNMLTFFSVMINGGRTETML